MVFATRALLILLCICLCLSFVVCGDNTKLVESGEIEAGLAPMERAWLDKLSEKKSDFTNAVIPDYSGGDTVNIGTGDSVSYVNPFYLGNPGETASSDLVSVKLFDTDREGNVVLSGRMGETKEHNGTEYTYYGIADGEVSGNTLDISLRDDIYFSDGVNLTADDVIFSMYVLADPAYDGSCGFAGLPISGMAEYRNGMDQKWKLILEDLSKSSEYSSTLCYTKEEFESFVSAFNEVGIAFTKAITEENVNIFAGDYSGFVLNKTADQIRENEGLKIAFAEYFCGYAKGLDSSDGLWYDSNGKSYDLVENYPTVEEFWQLILEKRGYDISDDGINYEKLGSSDFAELLSKKLNNDYPGLTVAAERGKTANTITGIEKTGMYSLRLTFDRSPLDCLSSLCIPVCPLHYYGSRDSYKYTENRFGFTKGDLTQIKASDLPLGAGAYVFAEYMEGGAALSRNTGFFMGCPKITNINIGRVDPDISLSLGNAGDATVDSDRYVCIGLNCSRVNVDGEDCSDASVSLRRAFCTLFEAYKNKACEEYGVQTASFEELQTEAEEAVNDALNEATELLKQAGYVWDNNSGRFTAAPNGAAMKYEIRMYTNDAASRAVELASEDLTRLGITLDIITHSSVESLVNFVGSGGADMWIMSVTGGVKDIIDGLFNETGNVFMITSEELDSQVKALDTFESQSERNGYCTEIINRLTELGVFVPVYRETDWVSYSDNVIEESITPDMTETWTWLREIYLLEMK